MDVPADKKLLLKILGETARKPFRGSLLSSAPQAPGRDILPHTHPWFRLVFPVSGRYRFKYWRNGLVEGDIRPGEVLATLPGGVLANVHTPPCRVASLIFRDNVVRCLVADRRGDSFKQQWFHTSSPMPSFGRSMIDAVRELPPVPDYDDIRNGLLLSILETAMLEIKNDVPSRTGKSFGTYQEAVAFIKENLQNHLDRAKVAKGVLVTPSHVSKLFRKFSGKDFKDVLKALRVERSLSLLKNRTLTIQEIACMCGFKSPSHFIRVFKKARGSTPAVHRSRMASGRDGGGK